MITCANNTRLIICQYSAHILPTLKCHLNYNAFCSVSTSTFLIFLPCCLCKPIICQLQQASRVKLRFMGDGPRGIEVFPDHFAVSTSGANPLPIQTSPVTDARPQSCTLARRRYKSATSMLNLLNPRRLSSGSGSNGQEKVILTAAEVDSLRLEVISLDKRVSRCKAQLEHMDEILRSARLSGYLYIRARWMALPGEPPVIEDSEVDDWLPRFVILHGSCFFLYMVSTDLSPQDSTLLSDVVDVGSLPCIKRDDEETQYCFYILTRHGLRYECSSASKVQVNSWLSALRADCELASKSEDNNDLRNP